MAQSAEPESSGVTWGRVWIDAILYALFLQFSYAGGFLFVLSVRILCFCLGNYGQITEKGFA